MSLRSAVLLSLLPCLLAACGDASSKEDPAAKSEGKSSPGPGAAKAPAGEAQKPRKVHVHALSPRLAEDRLPSTSHLEAWRHVEIVSRVQAQVLEVRAIEGREVREGEILVVLESRQAQLELDAARAREVEIADLEKEAGIALADAEARLALAEKDVAQAANDLRRSRDQAKEDLVSAAQLEAEELAYERASNQVDLQRIAVRKAELGVQKIRNEKATAEIERRIRERALEDYTIRAPFDGVVAATVCKGGEWIAPQGKLLELTDPGRLVVYFARPQQELGRIRAGLPVELGFDAFPGRSFSGEIAFVSPIVERQTGTFRARAEIADGEGLLRAGMFTRAEIITKRSPRALLVPRTAIFYDGDQPYCFVARDAKARRLQIAAGIATKSAIEATNREGDDGFRDEELVIVVGAEGLEDGRAVEITGRRDGKGRLIDEDSAAKSAKSTKSAADAKQDG